VHTVNRLHYTQSEAFLYTIHRVHCTESALYTEYIIHRVRHSCTLCTEYTVNRVHTVNRLHYTQSEAFLYTIHRVHYHRVHYTQSEAFLYTMHRVACPARHACTLVPLLSTLDAPFPAPLHTRRALSSTTTSSHQKPVPGQACNPPDAHGYLSFFGKGVTVPGTKMAPFPWLLRASLE